MPFASLAQLGLGFALTLTQRYGRQQVTGYLHCSAVGVAADVPAGHGVELPEEAQEAENVPWLEDEVDVAAADAGSSSALAAVVAVPAEHTQLGDSDALLAAADERKSKDNAEKQIFYEFHALYSTSYGVPEMLFQASYAGEI